MPERATVYESSQIAPESTPGTFVAATRRLLATEFDPDIDVHVRPYRPMGVKATTMVSHGKPLANVKVMGDMAYLDQLYLLSSLLQKVSPTTPVSNGKWNVTVGAASAGSFSLTFNGQTTAAIAYNASAAVVQTALEQLNTIGVGRVIVTGTAPNWLVTFVGPLSTTVLSLTGAAVVALTGGAFASTVDAAAVNTRRWTIFPGYLTPDTVQTFSLEKGVSGASGLAQKFAYLTMRQMQMKINKDECSFSGEALAQFLSDAYTMTATGSVTETEPLPIDPSSVSAYICDALTPGTGGGALTGPITSSTNATPIVITDAAHGLVSGEYVSVTGHLINTAANGYWQVTVIDANTFSLDGSVGNGVGAATGTWTRVSSIVQCSRLARLLDAEINIGNRFSPIVTIEAEVPSMSGVVEDVPTLDVKFQLEHDAAGQALLAKTMANKLQFLIIEATGTSIETGFVNRYKMTLPCHFVQTNKVDVGGVYCSEFSGVLSYDISFGGWIKVEIDSIVASIT